MNILIVEDDLYFANRIKYFFEKLIVTNRITIVTNYLDFISELNKVNYYDIILTDIKIQRNFDKTWIHIIEIIRNKKINIPIVVISCLWEISWLERAFFIWANDYLIKPFRLKELEIRVLRWFKIYYTSLNLVDNKVFYKWLEYDLNSNQFYFNWNIIKLGKRSKYILSLFLSVPWKIITEMEFVERIWGGDYLDSKKNIRVNILRLKKSLKEISIDDWIENIRWEWYILKSK